MLSKRKYWFHKYKLVLIIGIISIFLILIIRFFEWRPLPYSKYSHATNYILETLSYSLIAAIILIFGNDYYSNRLREKVASNHIRRQIYILMEQLRMLINLFEPLKMDRHPYTEDIFTHKFENKNLYDKYLGGDRLFIDIIKEKREYITSIAENLISSYLEFMTKNEIEFLQIIMESEFINNNLNPIDFSVNQSDRIFMNSNQKEIGRSIFQLYNSRNLIL